MDVRSTWTAMAVVTILGCSLSAEVLAQTAAPRPPAGFTALFNGKNLEGWRGRPGGGGVFSPYVEAKFTPEERAAKQAERPTLRCVVEPMDDERFRKALTFENLKRRDLRPL